MASCRVLGNEAYQLHLAAAEQYRDADDPERSAAALCRAAEHAIRYAGMYAERSPRAALESVLQEAADLLGARADTSAALALARAQMAARNDTAASDLTDRATKHAAAEGDPLLLNSAQDLMTETLLLGGRVVEAAAVAAARLRSLIDLPLEPIIGLELRDALHTASFTALGAGDLLASQRCADEQAGLPFLRVDLDLACDDQLAPLVLAGRWEQALLVGDLWRTGWERSGRVQAPGRGLAPAAMVLLHGLRGDEDERATWLTVLGAVRGPGPRGYDDVFDALVALEQGRPQDALATLTAPTAAADDFHHHLFDQLRAALTAEAAVLTGDAQAGWAVEAAVAATQGNPLATTVTRRATALADARMSDLQSLSADFERIGSAYQRDRTLALSRGSAGRLPLAPA